jgi:type III secretion protein U
MQRIFRLVSHPPNLATQAGPLLVEAIQVIFKSSVPLMAIVAAIGVLVNFLLIGPLFSMESMKPDIKRLNPVTNIKNMFKIKTFVELLKSIFKIAGALILIYTVVNHSIQEIVATCGMPIFASALIFASFLKQVILKVVSFSSSLVFLTLFFKEESSKKRCGWKNLR